MGELHLEIKVDILRRTYKVDANVGAPQVAYRETLTPPVADRLHAQEADRRFGPVRPKSRSSSSRCRRARASCSRTRSSAARCPKEFIPGVEKGLKLAERTGVLAGFPVIDFKATLIDGNYHDVEFERADLRHRGPRGVPRAGVAKARCKLLEPIMKVEVVTPDDYIGDVIGDLNSRRGQVQGQDSARQCAGHRRDGAARQHVRLHQQRCAR